MVSLYYWKVTSTTSGSYVDVPGEGEIQVSGSAFGGFYRSVFNTDNDSLVYYTGNAIGGYNVEENDGHLFLILAPNDFSNITIWQADKVSPNILNEPGTVIGTGGTFAIVGDYVYYHVLKDPWTYFMKQPLAGGSAVTLLHGEVGGNMTAEDNYMANFGSLYSVGDNLFQVITANSGEEVTINQLDLSTGNIAKGTTWQFDTNDYSSPKFFTDDQALYYAAMSKNASTSSTGESQYEIDIYRLTSSEFNAGQAWEQVTSIDAGNGSNAPEIQFATANNNYVLLAYSTTDQPSTYLLFDPNLDQIAQVYPPDDPASGQLFVMPESQGTPSSTTNSPVNAGIVGPLTLAQNCNLTVSVSPQGGGTVLVQGNVVVSTTQTQEFPEFTKVTLAATPAKGYKFSNWSGDISGATSSSSISFNIDFSGDIVANFTATQ
jgi:hypothetical protein